MEFPLRHWSPIQRRYPYPVQVANTNFMRFWHSPLQQHVFRNFHCSFLFKGSARLCVDGMEYRPSAPCAFIIYPREIVDFSANSPENGWHQLYYDFEAPFVPAMERIRLVSKARRVWPLANPGGIWALAEELCSLSHTFPLEQVVDHVDRLCERILIESQTPVNESREDEVIARTLQKMRNEPQQPFNLTETIRLINMSEATFRRRWETHVGMSPRRYLEQLRVQTACRLLIETGLPMNEIASKVGFRDEFYFSRRFRAMKGLSPRAYRKQHKRG